jgi:hypothetical protein
MIFCPRSLLTSSSFTISMFQRSKEIDAVIAAEDVDEEKSKCFNSISCCIDLRYFFMSHQSRVTSVSKPAAFVKRFLTTPKRSTPLHSTSAPSHLMLYARSTAIERLPDFVLATLTAPSPTAIVR